MASTSDFASEDGWLRARLTDAIDQCDRYACPRFVGFLDERQKGVATGILRHIQGSSFAFYGGHPEAERTMVGVFPDYMEPEDACFPITPVGFTYRQEADITHRDVLGTLLSCGIKRDKIGDVLCGEGLSVVFADEDIAPFLAEQVDKIKREGVRCQLPYEGELPAAHTFLELRGTVASPRLDAITKVAAGISREEAARRIGMGLVSLNHAPCMSVSTTVGEGDILSIRGVGRFRVATLGPLTKKGRVVVTLLKYC